MTRKGGKVIKGPIHGFIELSPLQEKLLAQPELQRLAWIKQLGLVFLVYPGAHQTRLEHSLGTSHLCGEIAEHLGLEEGEKELLEAAGMLHDLGHAPFSHSIEPEMEKDHMQATKNLVTGEEDIGLPDSGQIPSILEGHGLELGRVADLVTGEFSGEKYLQDVISSQLDADQLDYLARDSHYTGVSYGAIEVGWLINVMRLNQGRLTYLEKGIDGLEDCLLARDHMYSSVYCHKTASIAEQMLLRALQEALDQSDLENVFWMTDGELLEALKASNPHSKELVKRIQHRKLYKQAYTIKNTDLDAVREKFTRIKSEDERKIEGEIAQEAGVEEGKVIVNKQNKALVESEPRLREFNIQISRKNGEVVPLEEISRITRALKEKKPLRNLFSVYTTPEHREVGEAVESYLESQ